MNNKELLEALSLEYGRNQKIYSDPMELLEHVVDISGWDEQNRRGAIELAEEIYFSYNDSRDDYNKDR